MNKQNTLSELNRTIVPNDDKELLDWLEKNLARCLLAHTPGMGRYDVFLDDEMVSATTLRQAIRNAIRLENPNCIARNRQTHPVTSDNRELEGVPDGYRLLAGIEIILVGDILADCEGKWRGPIPVDWPGVGQLVRDYTTSKSGDGLPAARGIARSNTCGRTHSRTHP